MAGIDECERHPVAHRQRAVVANRHELAQAALGVLLAVERCHGLQPFPLAVLVEPVDVALLDARGIGEHDLAKIPRGVGGINVTCETILGEVGQVAAVVDVRV